MDKEQLKTKVDALEANADTLHKEFLKANVAVQAARQEIANAGKPVISESVVADLTEQLVEMFTDVVSNADVSDMSPEFGLSYNEITLECLDMSNIGISDYDIQAVLEEFFAIEKDEDEDEDDDNS